MAARVLNRSLAALGRASLEMKLVCRGYASTALKFQSEDNVDANSKARQSAASPPRVRLPVGIFSDFFPPLGRSASLLNMMDTMEDLFNSSSLSSSVAPQAFRNSSNRTPWDVMEDEKAFKLRLDMPGLSKDEVKVDIEEGNLTIKGEHKAEEGEDDWSSRSAGSYNIKIKLPENVKADAIRAELKHGVLRVTAPKVQETKKRLEVRVQ